MSNKRVEELVREELALRTCDRVSVEFLCAEGFYEAYKVVDYIDSNHPTTTHIREAHVIIKDDEIILSSVIVEWNDHDGRPDVKDDAWYNLPSHMIYEASRV